MVVYHLYFSKNESNDQNRGDAKGNKKKKKKKKARGQRIKEIKEEVSWRADSLNQIIFRACGRTSPLLI